MDTESTSTAVAAPAFKYDPALHTVRRLKPGKQGMVGVISSSSDDDKNVVYKFSSLLNMNGAHEYIIINSLKPLRAVCPYFPTNAELSCHMIDSSYSDSACTNPFEITSKHRIVCDVCISEYVDSARKLTAFIEHPDVVHESIVTSLLKQTLMGVLMAHTFNGFTHYDLHSENILVQKCPYDDVYMWFNPVTGVPYVVPSLGYIPRIIDYGFSYSDDVKGNVHTAPLDFMKEGYMSFRSDPFADFRILLTSTMDDLYYYRRGDQLFSTQRGIVKRLFRDVNMDWSSGWLKDVKACAVKYIYEMCSTCKLKDTIFASPTIDEHFYAILDLLQLGINVPVTSDPHADKKEMADVFSEFLVGMREFVYHFRKLEGMFESNVDRDREDYYEPNPVMGLYIIRASMRAVLVTRSEYKGPNQSPDAVRRFRNELHDDIRRAGVIHKLPKINYEKYMVSFHVMSSALHSLLYREIQYRERYIKHQYSRIPVNDSHDIFYIFNHYLNIPYTYVPEKTRVILMDPSEGNSKFYTLDPSECDMVNSPDSVTSLAAAEKLYAIVQSKTPTRVVNQGTNLLDAIYMNDVDISSPSQTVRMSEWTDDDADDGSSSDESDFDVKYDWSLESVCEDDGDDRKYIHMDDYVDNTIS